MRDFIFPAFSEAVNQFGKDLGRIDCLHLWFVLA